MARSRGLSLQALQLLAVMLEDPTAEYWGSDLGQRLGLMGGTVYPLLRRMEDAGWLSSTWEGVDPTVAGRPRRRLYRLTGEGERVAQAELVRLRTILQPPPQPRMGLT